MGYESMNDNNSMTWNNQKSKLLNQITDLHLLLNGYIDKLQNKNYIDKQK